MKKLLLGIVLVCSVIGLAACGGGDNSGSQSVDAVVETSETAAAKVNIIATDFKFDQEEYKVKSGEPIDFTLTNEQGNHGIEIKKLGITLAGGETKQFKITEPGTYEIVCNIFCGSGHNDMTAKLIVE